MRRNKNVFTTLNFAIEIARELTAQRKYPHRIFKRSDGNFVVAGDYDITYPSYKLVAVEEGL